jgi:hypothetical protein
MKRRDSLRRSLIGDHRVAISQMSRRRLVQILLGIVWLVDGILQLQPSMFTRSFVINVLLPTADGNPRPLQRAIVAVNHFIEPHIAIWNLLFALLQLLIGLGLLVRSTVRPALAVSFVWSVLVWIFAEGLGGLLTGTGSPLSGAPGAVLLYILIGLLVWPQAKASAVTGRSAAANEWLLGETGVRVVWALLWVSGAALLFQPSNLAKGAVANLLVVAKAGQPAAYAHLLSEVGTILAPYGTSLTIVAAVLMTAVGLGVVFDWAIQPLVAIAIVIAIGIWILPEGLGGILTGSGTDPNTGPLLVLVALAVYWSYWENKATRSSQGVE